MPVYNALPHLRAAVDGILAQTFRDFEFVIIDDGSTDGSTQMLQAYAAADPRIVLVSRPNTGYAIALNEALALAAGEFVARMDADDVSLPDRLARQMEYLQSHPNCVVVGAAVRFIAADGTPIARGFRRPRGHEEIDAFHLRRMNSALAHPTVMMRRNAVVAVGGYRPEFEPAEDLDLWLRLAERGRLANSGEVLLEYRVHPTSVTHRRRLEQQRKSYEAVAEACRRRGRTPPPAPVADRPAAGGQQPPVASPELNWVRLACGHADYPAAWRLGLRAVGNAPLKAQSWRAFGLAVFWPVAPAMIQLRRSVARLGRGGPPARRTGD
jgi:glycosyltransferase involved in cell wall biosynthesis